MRWWMAVIVLFVMASGVRGQEDSTVVQKDSALVDKDTIIKITQLYQPDREGYDKIRLDSGDSLIVNILAETQTEVAFRYPLNTMINKMAFSRIKEIAYKDGKIKAVQNQSPVAGVGTEPDNLWRIVVVTYEENDVTGLKEIGPIASKAEGKTLKTKIELLEKNATVNLQKKAVRMNATKVLVKKKNVEQSYGELPLVELEGVAYGMN